MELSWRFRLSHYLNKNPTDFEWLVKTLRRNDEIVAPERRRGMDIVLSKYKKDGSYPGSLIKRLCQYFSDPTARELTAAVFPRVNMTSHKDYNVKCPTELVVATADFDCAAMGIARTKMLELLKKLTSKEIRRVKVFLGDTVVEEVRHIPYGTIELINIYDLSRMIVNRLHVHYKCVMFAILTALGRNDLLSYLQIPYDTTLVA